ncbi:MAG: baseplate J/gp47 family protein, partial [Eubacterium sp.]
FQWLAREASSSVGRAHCLKKRNAKNEVCTIIIPVRPTGVGYDVKLIPSRELIRRVKEYLNERKLVGTPICVQAPVYKEFNITLAITLKSDVLDEGKVKAQIENVLHRSFDCLEGDEGFGWEFGKEVTVGMIMKQLEKINEIFSINSIDVFDIDADVVVEKIILRDDELPFLRTVIIEQR